MYIHSTIILSVWSRFKEYFHLKFVHTYDFFNEMLSIAPKSKHYLSSLPKVLPFFIQKTTLSNIFLHAEKNFPVFKLQMRWNFAYFAQKLKTYFIQIVDNIVYKILYPNSWLTRWVKSRVNPNSDWLIFRRWFTQSKIYKN